MGTGRGKQLQKERETETERQRSLVQCLNSHNKKDCITLKAGARSSMHLFHLGGRTHLVQPSPLPSKVCITWSQEWELGIDTLMQDTGIINDA